MESGNAEKMAIADLYYDDEFYDCLRMNHVPAVMARTEMPCRVRTATGALLSRGSASSELGIIVPHGVMTSQPSVPPVTSPGSLLCRVLARLCLFVRAARALVGGRALIGGELYPPSFLHACSQAARPPHGVRASRSSSEKE
ncbi:hypothetical protein Bbelb_331800 [Branchiostoma belcheri]|nr:hypothetical protein Bbelb_331800 [Branchiostoma belcheri]